MESKANYALVGLTVIVLSLGIVLAIFWISTRGSSADDAHYIIYFQDQSLDGLQVDSNVTMKGIKVGAVSSFSILPTNIERVRVLIRVKLDTPIKKDTRAVIRRNLLTGLAYIDLANSSQRSPLLVDVPTDETFPVIPEGISELRQITDSVPNLLEKGGALFDRVKLFLSDENAESVRKILGDTAALAGTLGKHEKTIDRLIGDLGKVATDFRNVGDALSRATEEGKIDGLTEDLRHAADEIATVVSNLDRQIRLIVQTVVRSADQLVANSGELTSEVARAARDFSALAERFQDPRAAVLGPNPSALGPGEKIAEAKDPR